MSPNHKNLETCLKQLGQIRSAELLSDAPRQGFPWKTARDATPARSIGTRRRAVFGSRP